MSLLLALLLIVLYTIEGKTKIQWRRYGGVQNYLFAAEYTHSLSPIRSNQETVFTVCGLGNT